MCLKLNTISCVSEDNRKAFLDKYSQMYSNTDKMPKGQSAKMVGTLDDALALEITEIIRSKPDITLDELSTEAGIARRTLSRYMSVLKESGRVERIGGKRYGYWKVTDE